MRTVITKQAKWTTHEHLRGVKILKREVGSGSSMGKWMAAATYFDTLATAREYVMNIPDSSLIVYQDHSRAI